jgi:hypothetical protein
MIMMRALRKCTYTHILKWVEQELLLSNSGLTYSGQPACRQEKCFESTITKNREEFVLISPTLQVSSNLNRYKFQ